MMIGVDDDKVDQAIEIVRENCALTVEPAMKRAALFVLNVDRFTQI
jgi:uncharacterized protein YaaQ